MTPLLSLLSCIPMNMSSQRAMFSMSSVIGRDIFNQLEVDPKWAEHRQFRLIDEENTESLECRKSPDFTGF